MKAVTYEGVHKVSVSSQPRPKVRSPTDAILRVTTTLGNIRITEQFGSMRQELSASYMRPQSGLVSSHSKSTATQAAEPEC